MSQSSPEAVNRTVADVIARATTDEDFRAALVADPRGVLVAAGVELPDGLEVRVLENSAAHTHFVLPSAGELGDEILAGAAGGSTVGSASSIGTASTLMSCVGCGSSAGTAGSA